MAQWVRKFELQVEASTPGSDGARKVVHERSKDLSLIASMMDGHSRDGIREMDTIALWEHLRRMLTFELSNNDTVRQAGAMGVSCKGAYH